MTEIDDGDVFIYLDIPVYATDVEILQQLQINVSTINWKIISDNRIWTFKKSLNTSQMRGWSHVGYRSILRPIFFQGDSKRGDFEYVASMFSSKNKSFWSESVLSK